MGSFWAGGLLGRGLLAGELLGLGCFLDWGAFGWGAFFWGAFILGGFWRGAFGWGAFFWGAYVHTPLIGSRKMKLTFICFQEWKSRKRMFSDISDAILENYPHPKKDFFEEMSIETDQDAGAVMPDWSY